MKGGGEEGEEAGVDLPWRNDSGGGRDADTVLCKTALTLCASDDFIKPLSAQGTPCYTKLIIEY